MKFIPRFLTFLSITLRLQFPASIYSTVIAAKFPSEIDEDVLDIFLLRINELINLVTENVSKILLLLVSLSVFKSLLGIWAER